MFSHRVHEVKMLQEAQLTKTNATSVLYMHKSTTLVLTSNTHSQKNFWNLSVEEKMRVFMLANLHVQQY